MTRTESFGAVVVVVVVAEEDGTRFEVKLPKPVAEMSHDELDDISLGLAQVATDAVADGAEHLDGETREQAGQA